MATPKETPKPDLTYAERVAWVTQQAGVIPHDAKAVIPTQKGRYSFTYASLGAIKRVVDPLCDKMGLAVRSEVRMEHAATGDTPYLWSSIVDITVDGGPLYSTTYPLHFTDRHQDNGAAITYGRRYSYALLFNLDTEQDIDAITTMVEPEEKPDKVRVTAEGEARGAAAREALAKSITKPSTKRPTRKAQPQVEGEWRLFGSYPLAVHIDQAVCPSCGQSSIFDVTADNKAAHSPKRPKYRCGNRDCEGGGGERQDGRGWPWTGWELGEELPFDDAGDDEPPDMEAPF